MTSTLTAEQWTAYRLSITREFCLDHMVQETKAVLRQVQVTVVRADVWREA